MKSTARKDPRKSWPAFFEAFAQASDEERCGWKFLERDEKMTLQAKPHVHVAICQIKKELDAHGGITKSRKAPDVIGGFAFRGIDDADNVLGALRRTEGAKGGSAYLCYRERCRRSACRRR